MKATTEDWTLAEQRSARWRIAEQRAAVGDMNCQCLLDLRAGIETLEQRALTAPEPSAAEPAPEPAANRPLWKVMYDARCDVLLQGEAIALRTSAEIDAAADWLAARDHCGAASALRIEARRAREGA